MLMLRLSALLATFFIANGVQGQGCGTGSNQNSQCRDVFINSVTDFCLYAPPNPGPDSVIGNTERIEVAWCTKSGRGTRLIPDGTLTGVHFIQTPDFVQITGIGKLTNLNIPFGDDGGELDPHGADGQGNPIGGRVFSSAFGGMQEIAEWTNFMSDRMFCIRACKPGPKAATFCQHIYDVMGCAWNMPGNYGGGFDTCAADSGEPMGVYGTSTFHQGQPSTPAAHPAPASSQCRPINTVANGSPDVTTPPITSKTTSTTTSTTSSTKTTTSSIVSATTTTSSTSSATATATVITSSGTSHGLSSTSQTSSSLSLTTPPPNSVVQPTGTSTSAPLSVTSAAPSGSLSYRSDKHILMVAAGTAAAFVIFAGALVF